MKYIQFFTVLGLTIFLSEKAHALTACIPEIGVELGATCQPDDDPCKLGQWVCKEYGYYNIKDEWVVTGVWFCDKAQQVDDCNAENPPVPNPSEEENKTITNSELEYCMRIFTKYYGDPTSTDLLKPDGDYNLLPNDKFNDLDEGDKQETLECCQTVVDYVNATDKNGMPITCTDNCPNVYNPEQEDADGNGVGDVCESENEENDEDEDNDDDNIINIYIDSCCDGVGCTNDSPQIEVITETPKIIDEAPLEEFPLPDPQAISECEQLVMDSMFAEDGITLITPDLYEAFDAQVQACLNPAVMLGSGCSCRLSAPEEGRSPLLSGLILMSLFITLIGFMRGKVYQK